MRQLWLVLFALCAFPLTATAGDLPVSYTVDEKALKAAVVGTDITFDLYTDSVCSGVPAHTQTVNVEDVNRVSRLKLGVPKGAAKPPKTAVLEETLAGVTVEGNVYLKVTGTGITAVGGDCQVQGAQIAQAVPAIPGGLTRSLAWNPTLTAADDNPSPPHVFRYRTSSTSFPVGSAVTAVYATLTGNLSGCANWTAYVTLPQDFNNPPPVGEGTVYFGYHPGSNVTGHPAEDGLNYQLTASPFPQTLSATVFCYNGTFSGDVSIDLTISYIEIPTVID
jgi:hypothetical protein